MKITDIQTTIVNAAHRNWIFVKVLTDQPGLYGWGEATLEWKTRAIVGTIEDFKPLVLGEDPRRIEHVLNRMLRMSFWPMGVIGLTAASGIEQALWDIKAKDLGVPVWQLLGGQMRDHVRVYTHMLRGSADRTVSGKDISAFCDAAQETVEMGYNALKLGFVPYTGYSAELADVKHAGKLAEAVRERVGDEVAIMTDFHGRPDSLDSAKAYIDALSPIGLLFVEEPIQPGDTPAMADLAHRVNVPLATGERLFTPEEYAEVARTRAISIAQPDLCHCGGLTWGKKIGAICEAGHIGLAPHNPNGPVSGVVALHFDVASPNFVIQEEAVGIVPWFSDVCEHPIVMKDGAWQIPDKPGFGIEINEAEAAKHPFEQEPIMSRDAFLPDGTVANW